MDTASNAVLENEFGTHKEEDVVQQILEKGDVQETEVQPPTVILHKLQLDAKLFCLRNMDVKATATLLKVPQFHTTEPMLRECDAG